MKLIINKILTHKSIKLITIFLVQGISAVFGFLVHYLLTQNMSVDEYGKFGILFNTISILSLIITFGSTNHILRTISINNNDQQLVSKELMSSLMFIVINWLALAFVIIFITQIFQLGKDYTYSFELTLLSLFLILFTAFSQLFQNFDRAIGYVLRSLIPNSIYKSITLISSIYLLSFLYEELDVTDVIFIYLLSFVIINLIYAIYEFKYLNYKKLIENIKYNYTKCFKESYQYFINTISQTLLKNLDLIIIGFFLTTYDAGVYGVATRINMVVIFGLASLNILYSPQIAKLYSENKIKKLNESLHSANWIIFIFSLSLFLAITILGKSILEIFGEEYVSGYMVLVILSLRNLIEAFFGITGSVLNMSGNQKYFNFILYFMLLLYLIFSPLSIKIGSLEGLAVFITLITFIKNLFQWRFIYFKLGIRSGLFSNIYFKLSKTL